MSIFRRAVVRVLQFCLLLVLFPDAVVAQENGLVLGFRYSSPIERPLPYYAGDADSLNQASYYTLYLVRTGDTVRLEHKADELLIPRENDILRAGTRRSVYNNWVEDFVWTARPQQQPTVSGIQPFNGENCEGYREQIIHFATATYLSVEQQTAGYCDGAPHPWFFNSLAVVPVDSVLHSGHEIQDVLGRTARQTFDSAVTRLLEEEGLEDEYVEHPDPANWAIRRSEGAWNVFVRVNLADQIAVADYRDLILDLRIPRRLVERNEAPVPLRTVRRVAPDAVDYFTSPLNDLIVIQRSRRLTVHPLRDGKIGRLLFEVEIRPASTAVLARWASGAQAERWTRMMDAPRLSARSSKP